MILLGFLNISLVIYKEEKYDIFMQELEMFVDTFKDNDLINMRSTF